MVRSTVSRRNKEFIAWDGEGTAFREPVSRGRGVFHWEGERDLFFDHETRAQPYVLLGNSKEERITNEEGLSTRDCFEFLLDTKSRYPNSIFVGFAFNYDVNQILKDVPKPILWELHEQNQAKIGSYYVKWLPRKSFYIRHGKTKRSMILYDVFSFFQSSFLQVCKEYLGESDPELALIQRGKDARELFKWDELDDFIIPYNDTELSMLVRVMNILRQDFLNVDIKPSKWHGPGAVADKVFRKECVPIDHDIPSEVLDAAQFAYAGGRFEQFYMGRHAGTVYEYDIRSAYPEATTHLPDLQNGDWEHVEGYEPGTFGVWNVDYVSHDWLKSDANRPQPLFCRSEQGYISYPVEVEGWYWTPEADLVADCVREGWVFRPFATTDRPFAFVESMYEQRRLLKEQGNSTQRALKLILNSLYGKLAQTIGYKDGPPTWHQLEYAGYITSYTRAKIYNAIQQNPDAIVATETDAVFSMEPLDLDIGTGLGQWEQTEFTEITYLQSGLYYARTLDGDIVSKYRGMDRDKKTRQPAGLPYEEVLSYLQDSTGHSDGPSPTLTAVTTRFVGLGLGLRTQSEWRSWEKKARLISLDQDPWTNSKRYHSQAICNSCIAGVSMYDRLHTMKIGGYEGKSHARALPWRSIGGEVVVPISWEEWQEMNPDVKDFMDDLEKWQ